MTHGEAFCVAGCVAGDAHPMPGDPRVHAVGDAITPCNRLVCGACGEPVLHLDGVSFDAHRFADTRAAREARDPIAWLAFGDFVAGTRLYACGCAQVSYAGYMPAADLDTKEIDHWRCGGHPTSETEVLVRPQMRSWLACARERLPIHFSRGGWLALDAAYEGLPSGGLRRHAWSEDEARALSADERDALCERLLALPLRRVARQLAPPTWTSRPSYAAMVEKWSHGELDSVETRTTAIDVPSLLVATREIAARLRAERASASTVVPGLASPSGYLRLDDHG